MRLLIESQSIQDIPALTITPENGTHLPMVFYIPGYTQPKESGLSLGYRLACRGLSFTSFDPLYHGERYDEILFKASEARYGGVYPAESGLDAWIVFMRVIAQCLPDVQTLIEHFIPDPRFDMSRCGVAGPSMGGYASFLVFANLPYVKAAVPMIGIPSFTRRWLDLVDECTYTNQAWAAAIRQAEDEISKNTAFIEHIDPYEKLKSAAPRALFIQNCDFDYDQPKSYSIACYRDLLPYYAAHLDKLRLGIYPAAHIVSAKMEGEAVDWFAEQLAG